MNTLFVCNGNVARSQEAAIFFSDFAEPEHRAISAGVNAKPGGMDPPVETVLAELGYSMEGCHRKSVTPNMVRAADLIVSFKPVNELPEWMAERLGIRYWQVSDPKGKSVDFHRAVRDRIFLLSTKLASELKAK